ncbi:MAG: hypothetical protein WAN14_21625 [Candidatus Acidiferrales bacterium]
MPRKQSVDALMTNDPVIRAGYTVSDVKSLRRGSFLRGFAVGLFFSGPLMLHFLRDPEWREFLLIGLLMGIYCVGLAFEMGSKLGRHH